jgi:hypothetical protein
LGERCSGKHEMHLQGKCNGGIHSFNGGNHPNMSCPGDDKISHVK